MAGLCRTFEPMGRDEESFHHFFPSLSHQSLHYQRQSLCLLPYHRHRHVGIPEKRMKEKKKGIKQKERKEGQPFLSFPLIIVLAKKASTFSPFSLLNQAKSYLCHLVSSNILTKAQTHRERERERETRRPPELPCSAEHR